MGLFDRFKKPAKPAALDVTVAQNDVVCPVSGEVVELAAVSDPVFSTGAMGLGFGVKPSDETIYAPISGTISVLGAPNFHALGISGDNGAEFLIHVGVDTVEMKGDGFTVYAEKGQHINVGEALLGFSKKKIAAAGHDDVVICAITNSDDFSQIELAHTGNMQAGDVVILLHK
ncbi:PTS glucose transporter subunit IIA [uncultured Olegusella sp.]|uniref:PTS sugar transporter subunit IIA n=1 Tax=uncultured Olegusella sp. TaxID=1979846 RepID=UPI0026220E64|nr:PTS glucose transporter subunit IIA [uncultured Olegusella sp.]